MYHFCFLMSGYGFFRFFIIQWNRKMKALEIKGGGRYEETGSGYYGCGDG